jgi:glyoxylase-like metal-dependent hydrolase (beta-lactamase superfamily II)
MNHPNVRAFFDSDTYTVTYVVSDPDTRDAVVIDPVLDYDVLASQTSTTSVAQVISFLGSEGLRLRAVLETHAHADHISAAQYLKEAYAVPVAIGNGIGVVQETFKKIFNFPIDVPSDGSQFDLLLDSKQTYRFGSLEVKPIATPGHTPACMSYLVGDAVFTGDALFMEDYGTGRADFPGGSAKLLYQSVSQKLFSLPESTRVFVGHDYMPGGRAVRFESTIKRQRKSNVQLSNQVSEAEFIENRNRRDGTLRPPRLIYQSIQINVFGGRLPEAQGNGVRFLTTPLNLRKPTNSVGRPLLQKAEAAE